MQESMQAVAIVSVAWVGAWVEQRTNTPGPGDLACGAWPFEILRGLAITEMIVVHLLAAVVLHRLPVVLSCSSDLHCRSCFYFFTSELQGLFKEGSPA